MAAAHSTRVEQVVEQTDEPQVPSRLGRTIMRYYGWFLSIGIALAGALFWLGDDAADARPVLVTSTLLLAFQVTLEIYRRLDPRRYDSLWPNRLRAEAYIAAATALMLGTGGIESPFWLVFVLPIAVTALYGEKNTFFKYCVLGQMVLVDGIAVARAGWTARALVQGVVYAGVWMALLELTTTLYFLAHFRQEERLHYLQRLSDTAQHLIPRRSLADLAQDALEMALDLANGRQGFLLVTQRHTGRLLAHAIRGLSLSQGVTAQQLADSCRSLSERQVEGTRAVHLAEVAQLLYGRAFHDPIESALAVPISTSHSTAVATLHIISSRQSGFPPLAPSLLDVYAGQLGTALDNAFAWEEQDRTLRYYSSLIELGQQVMELQDPQLILDRVVNYVRDSISCVGGAYIFWLDSRSRLYVPVARSGRDLGLPAGEAAPLHKLFTNGKELPDQVVLRAPEVSPARWAALGVTDPPFGSLLAAQLRVAAKPMGLLLLGAREPQAFTPIDEVFLGNLAAHISLAYRNADLHQRLQANRARLARVLQERASWRLDQSLEALLTQIVHSAVQALGYRVAVIDLLDAERGGYCTRASANVPEEEQARLQNRLITREQIARALRPEFRVLDCNVYFIPAERKSAQVDWLRTCREAGDGSQSPTQWQPGDTLLVPLRRRDGVQVGLLTLDDPDDKARPTDEEARVIENLADQAIATLEQWRQNNKLRQLSETLAAMIEQTEATSLYQFIAHEGARLLDAEDCSLFLNNDRNGTVHFEASSCIPRQLFDRKEIPISAANGAGLTAYVAATGVSLYFVGDEYKTHPAWGGHFTEHLAYLPSRGCRSLLLVALRNPGGRITGVLKVENKQGIDANLGFSEFDREILLPTLANAAAMAIERAHLYWRTSDLLVQKERDRLAGELHDLANVFHMGIMLRIETLWDQFRGTPHHEPAQALHRLWHASRYVYGELVKMQEETRNPILIREGLLEALHNHCNMINLTGVELRDGLGRRLPVDVEHALYRIAQEALSNAKKHFQAVSGREIRVIVWLHQEGGNIVLEVSDNGPGFDKEKELQKPDSFGLTRMIEIAEGIRACCEINSECGQGTCVRVSVPYQDKEEMAPIRTP